jgi:hypothetical protein
VEKNVVEETTIGSDSEELPQAESGLSLLLAVKGFDLSF